jgi:hypothetical protein
MRTTENETFAAGEEHSATDADHRENDANTKIVSTSRPCMLNVSSRDAMYLAYYRSILCLPFIEERNTVGPTGIYNHF